MSDSLGSAVPGGSEGPPSTSEAIRWTMSKSRDELVFRIVNAVLEHVDGSCDTWAAEEGVRKILDESERPTAVPPPDPGADQFPSEP